MPLSVCHFILRKRPQTTHCHHCLSQRQRQHNAEPKAKSRKVKTKKILSLPPFSAHYQSILPLNNSATLPISSTPTPTPIDFSLSLSLSVKPKMAAPKLFVSLFVVAIWGFGQGLCGSSHQAPAPAVDCSSLILNMADCLSFVSNGSTDSKPQGTCCTGLKTVLKADAACLCEAFKSSAQLGVVLNITKAMALPSACKVSAPSATNCGLSVPPAAAPGVTALSPESSPTSAASGPGSSPGVNEQAPAASPGSSGSLMLSSSVGSILIGLVVASFPFI